jgi:TATA-box binding protein (TBP) (component of TFIID and TFIIIB)
MVLIKLLKDYANIINECKALDDDDIFKDYKENDFKCTLDEKEMKEINNSIKYVELPAKIKISTMTIACKTGCQINIHNIARFMDLHLDRIVSVKYGVHPLNNRSLIAVKKKKKSNKPKKRNFYNECTIQIIPTKIVTTNKSKNNPLNIKLFKNGSLQLTGVKHIEHFHEIIAILFHELKIIKAVIHNGKLVTKPFICDPKNLVLTSVQICMINTNFKLKTKIDREQLYEKLLIDRIKCKFEPLTHACVNIKYQCSLKKKVSIFVFESGAVIITGANNTNQIIEAYNFIITKIKKYGKDIIFVDIDDLFENEELKKYL